VEQVILRWNKWNTGYIRLTRVFLLKIALKLPFLALIVILNKNNISIDAVEY